MRVRTNKYLKSRSGTREILDGRLRIGFVRCPKCGQPFGFYQDEFYEDGRSRELISHSCGFREPMILTSWYTREPSDRIY